MHVFVAGATSAIGRPLITALLQAGHIVTAMTRDERAATALASSGARAVVADVFDEGAVRQALIGAEPDAVIDELNALPSTPLAMADAYESDHRVRLHGGGILFRAAEAVGVSRYLQQASGFLLRSYDGGLAVESSPLATNAPGRAGAYARLYADLELRLAYSKKIDGVALRYGFYYGPGTWYHAEGAVAGLLRTKQLAVLGDGQGVSSFVHVDDAAAATVAALAAPSGIYNIVDSDPLPQHEWLPALARFVGAPSPAQVHFDEALAASGADAVYNATQLVGASNAKARRRLGFEPRRLEWLEPVR